MAATLRCIVQACITTLLDIVILNPQADCGRAEIEGLLGRAVKAM